MRVENFRLSAKRVILSVSIAGFMLTAWMSTSGGATDPAANSVLSPDVWLHENWLAGLLSEALNLEDSAAVFRTVFSSLPPEVTVWPTENYYYWQLACGGRSLMGNIRLGVNDRDRGELGFAYGEPRAESRDANPEDRLKVSRTFTGRDGVIVRGVDDFTVQVDHAGKSVTFLLNRLSQSLPDGFVLGEAETLLQRTQDESGLRFLLLYERKEHYFFWVLDESERCPEKFRVVAPDMVEGRRTGFVFWIQPLRGERKVLTSVRRSSLRRNDYYDGPFDQLADNFVTGDGLRPYLEEAMPWLRGRVDARGNITDSQVPRRVALTVHGTHEAAAEAVAMIEAAKRSPDPIAVISRAGMDGSSLLDDAKESRKTESETSPLPR